MATSREYNAYSSLAKRLYVEEKKDYIELSTELPVNVDTLRDWGKRDEWDHARDLYDTNPKTIVRRLKRGLAEMSHLTIDSKTADALYKLAKTIESFEQESKEHFLVRAIEVVEQQKAYFERRLRDSADKRQQIGAALDEFLTYAEEAFDQ